ncbi:unnamed protein product [Periconia digitata]|uniref:Seipin n=1 Tax=Periconia digitata TaxID=1303443 RepID=A0A9W4UTB9_9PLEO|nr:unnamed protein product [Periconia digitata]
MDYIEDEADNPQTVFHTLKDAVLAPYRIATSPTLLRTYLTTILFFIASSILFAVAVVAYTSFYYAYIPIRGLSAPVYLQYNHAAQTPQTEGPDLRVNQQTCQTSQTRHPYGIANVQGLVSRQKYDIIVTMNVPRSERNLAAGNWMLSLEMRSPETGGGGMKGLLGWDEEWEVDDYSQGGTSGTTTDKVSAAQQPAEDLGSKSKADKPVVLARSRRPAILTYRSWTTELAHRVLRLPLYILGFGHEAEQVKVKMMEGVAFDKGWRNVPSSLRLEVRSKSPLEVYSTSVRVIARLEGIRYIMYTYRLSSAVLFTGVFWGVEMGVVLLTWGLFSLFFANSEHDGHRSGDGNPVSGSASNALSSPASSPSGIKQEDDPIGAITPKTEPAEESAPPTPMSDTSRTFPTLSGHQPLYYSSSEPKNEGGSGRVGTPGMEDVQIKEEEADDEEDDDFLLEDPPASRDLDSGIGTGLDSGVESGKGLGRRRSGRRGR